MWQGVIQTGGYGQIKHNGRRTLAHRHAWTLVRGEISPGKILCHRCDVPACVNPDHLFQGDHLDNSNDKLAKKRHARVQHFGVTNPATKYPLSVKREIRAWYECGGWRQEDLAEAFDVTQTVVSRAVRCDRSRIQDDVSRRVVSYFDQRIAGERT